MELKIGDVVYLNSNPEIKMTVSYVGNNTFQAILFNPVKHDFERTQEMPIQAVSLVKDRNS